MVNKNDISKLELVTIDGELYPQSVKDKMESLDKDLHKLNADELNAKYGWSDDVERADIRTKEIEELIEQSKQFNSVQLDTMIDEEFELIREYLDELAKECFDYKGIAEDAPDAFYGTLGKFKESEEELEHATLLNRWFEIGKAVDVLPDEDVNKLIQIRNDNEEKFEEVMVIEGLTARIQLAIGGVLETYGNIIDVIRRENNLNGEFILSVEDKLTLFDLLSVKDAMLYINQSKISDGIVQTIIDGSHTITKLHVERGKSLTLEADALLADLRVAIKTKEKIMNDEGNAR